MSTAPPDEREFDPDALRARYRAERDKRRRADGNEQYVEVTGAFARYLDDPYREEAVERAPCTDEVEVALIGGGFGGLLAGARLKDAGIDDVRIIEKGADVGGTWYWNRYPGAMCDVESYVYLPLLEEVGYVPTEKYAHAPEILAHCRAIAHHYGLYDGALLATEVTGLRWDEARERWIVSTDRGDALAARFVAMANGPLQRPKLPGIPGIESFAGHTFHTSRWDYTYTGGGPDGGLDGLHGKRVAIIGTGATAIQCVPHLGEAAAELFVFQRTPSSVDVRANRPTDPEWAAALEPGWHKHRMENFNALVSGIPQEEDLVDDGWTDIVGKLMQRLREGTGGSGGGLDVGGLAQLLELADFEKMEEIRRRVDELVDDPDVAEALKPYYRQFCKRPCFHDEYLQTFNRPNVHLVDTDGRGVERITETGVVANGVEHTVDCIIFATGFEVGTSYVRRAGHEVVGRGGVTLSEHWADGTRTLHGMHTRGFPNLFVMSQTQGGFTVNYPHMLDELATHIAHLVGEVRARGATTIEVSEAAEAAWVQTVVDLSGRADRFFEECTPGYYNNEGRMAERNRQDSPYGGGAMEFFSLLRAWRDAGTLEGLEVGGSPT